MPIDIQGGRARRAPEYFTGCLLGGAVGDALGAAVEFMSLAAIRAQFGPEGIRDLSPVYGRVGAITDDTQMTLFTAEGLLRAHNRAAEKGSGGAEAILVYHAYLRWLESQGERPHYPYAECRESWLLGVPALHARRAPGNTCLDALRTGRMGTISAPLNGSKGCGGVMRVAPAGLAGRDAFRLGCELAAISHGHPSGYLAAGFFAALIDRIIAGDDLGEAIGETRLVLRTYPNHEECLRTVDAALDLARQAPAVAESVERLGSGWVAEEALAIALFCALAADVFESALILAVNHSGDSDSTGALAGNILGALLGKGAIPERWLHPLELQTEIEAIALDLLRHFGGPDASPPEDDWERYPGY
jgi:ADP-ribosylglycohydrolase